jgi:hypothetical protein
VMIKNLFNPQKGNTQQEFWAWFQENETRIWNIDKNQDKVIRMVSEALQRVYSGLTFEIGLRVENGMRDFVISADGITGNIPKVESLYLTAPALPRWRIIKYRPRTLPIGEVRIEGRTTAAEDVRFQLFNDGDKVGLLLMFEDYTEATRNQFTRIAFLLLDRALGEHNVMTRVGFIDFAGKESNFYPDAHRLPELPKAFDDYFQINKE